MIPSALILFLFLLPTAVLGVEELQEIVVSESVQTNGTAITVGKKNRRTQINSLARQQTNLGRQVFAQQPSIYAPEQTTEPWMILNFRGLGTPQESQNVLVLQDGLPVSMDMYGSPDTFYSPPAPLMEEIQVIAGGGALMYGPASTATVNFLSPALWKDMPTEGHLNAAGGSYNLFSTVNSIKGSSGNLSYFMGYHRKQGDGLQRVNGDFSADSLQLKAHHYLPRNLTMKYAFQGYNSDFGMAGGMALDKAPGLNTWGEDNRRATREHNRLRVARAQLVVGMEKKISGQTVLESQVWSNAYRKYNKTQSGSGFGKVPTGTGNSINTSQAYGFNGEVRLKHDYNDHSLSVGYLTYNTNSPSVNEKGDEVDSNHGDTTSRLYRTTRTQAVFAENRFKLNKLSVVPGVRFENITLSTENNDLISDVKSERSDTYNVFLGGLGSSYALNERQEIFANVSEGFKPVGYEEVLSQGNPNFTVQGDIKPSKNVFYETGIKGRSKKVDWETSLYLTRRENILASTGNVLSNGSSAVYRGIESSVTFRNLGQFDLFLNANFVNAKYQRGEFEGKTPSHAPSLLFKAGLTYRVKEKGKLSLLNTYVQEHFSDDAHTDEYKVPSYMLYDLMGEYFLSSHWSVNGSINNLLDLQYYGRVMPTGVMPTMGRNMYAGVNYLFGN